MNALLMAAAILLFLLGVAHSYLGERFILIPLFRRGHLPAIFASEVLTARTLRFAWHLTSIAWWGAAVILLLLAPSPPAQLQVLVGRVLAATFLASGLLALCVSRGKHFSWVVFSAVALLTWFGVGR